MIRSVGPALADHYRGNGRLVAGAVTFALAAMRRAMPPGTQETGS